MKQLILSAIAIIGVASVSYSQCAFTSSVWGTGNAPAIGTNVNITTCAYAGGDHSVINNVVAGVQYTVTYTGGASNYVTVFDNTNTAIFWGANSVTFTAPYSGTFYSQTNLTGCGTDASCHTCNWEATPTPCAAAPYGLNATNITTASADLSWSADVGVVNYVVEWGAPGFAPGTGAQTGSAMPATETTIASGLSPETDYEFYVMTDCGSGVTTSWGGPYAFTTLPNCANVSGLAGTTVADSIFTSWSFTANPGFDATGFNIEYGDMGFTPGSGTMIWADANNTDTITNASFVGGGIYDVYVQSVCGADSGWVVGPLTVTMPLTNDMPCNAEELMTDGTVYYLDCAGATVDAGEAAIAPPGTDCTAQGTWCNSTISYSTWFTFVAPASGAVIIDGAEQGFDGQVAVYEVTTCDDYNTYTLLGANDDVGGGYYYPRAEVCGLTPGNTYYVMHDPYSSFSTGIYSLRIDAIVVEAGTDNGMINLCLGDTINLDNQISGQQPGGVWTGVTTSAGVTASMFNSAGLASQIFEFQYTVTVGCAMDSVLTSVQIYAPSSAGMDGIINTCKNQPINLLAGLSGNVDLGGTWYDPSNNTTSSDIIASGFSGQYNYDYITGNGVCPDDTSNVIVDVDANCDYLSIGELSFENISLSPNPTTGSVFITNDGSSEVFNYALTDMNGKVIVTRNNAISATETTKVSLETLEPGMYLIRIFNENAEKTYRVVKQ